MTFQDKVKEIILEISAYNKNSLQFKNALSQLLALIESDLLPRDWHSCNNCYLSVEEQAKVNGYNRCLHEIKEKLG